MCRVSNSASDVSKNEQPVKAHHYMRMPGGEGQYLASEWLSRLHICRRHASHINSSLLALESVDTNGRHGHLPCRSYPGS